MVQSPTRRRWLRFSLRGLLVVVTALAVWLGKVSIEARRQKEAVEWVLKNGGTVTYDWHEMQSLDEHWFNAPKKGAKPGPAWLREIIGDDFFQSVERVTIRDAGVRDIGPLANLTDLLSVSLENNQIEDLEPLSSLPKILHIQLDSNEICDLSSLSRLKHLETLCVSNNRISNTTPLARLTHLNFLGLNENDISDVSALASLPNLDALFLAGNEITDISPMRHWVTIDILDLTGNPIADFSSLKGMIGLKQLYLQDRDDDGATRTSVRRVLSGRNVEINWRPTTN